MQATCWRVPSDTHLRRRGLMHVRPMVRADVDAVAALYTQLGYRSSPDQILRRFDPIERHPDHGVFVAAGADSVIVGVIHVHVARLLEADAAAMIESLVVDIHHRGQGVGSGLVVEAERWAHEQWVAV